MLRLFLNGNSVFYVGEIVLLQKCKEFENYNCCKINLEFVKKIEYLMTDSEMYYFLLWSRTNLLYFKRNTLSPQIRNRHVRNCRLTSEIIFSFV